ncbi:MAG: hypothetical protein LLG00_09255 [Planctomycetaceae bacterium]|nr:hypothetical protein [Planctomycetaceae bacterium]
MMGALQRSSTDLDAKQAIAIEIALKVGLVEKCEQHGCVYDAMNDFAMEDAIRCGDALMTGNDPLVAPFGGNRRRLRHAIENVRTGLPNCCDDCYYSQHQK